MPGLVPGIHALSVLHDERKGCGCGLFFATAGNRHRVDARHKAGHDGKVEA
jgi:hypothetical protein